MMNPLELPRSFADLRMGKLWTPKETTGDLS